MQLRIIAPAQYAHQVLPLSAKLWAGRRTMAAYVAQTLEIAHSPYGKRSYRTLGLYDGGSLTASCKRYERIVRVGAGRLRTFGLGAVFTPEALRGRGYASAMIAMLLDAARSNGYDAAFLFSDIRPQFYEEVGFRVQPSRTVAIRTDSLPKARVEIERLEERDRQAVRRTFSSLERARAWSFVRTPLVWDWVWLRVRHGSEHVRGADAHFVVRERGSVRAYVLGMRVPERDAYVIDEFGWSGEHGTDLVPLLLRGAAGDLRRVTGWLPPSGAREILPRSSVRDRKEAIFMIAPLSSAGKRWCALSERASAADGLWSTDHV
ncbi:MAG: GNAT family N-acetyltransferase [Candidatus Tyrphobacter sp.]